CSTDVPAKFVPVTARLNAGPPDANVDGVIPVTVGTIGAGVTVSDTPLDVQTLFTHAIGFTTVIVCAPSVATSLAGIAACTCVADGNGVGRALPSPCTTAPETNPVPVTVIVNAGLVAATLAGLIVVTVGVGLMAWKLSVGVAASTVLVAVSQRIT